MHVKIAFERWRCRILPMGHYRIVEVGLRAGNIACFSSGRTIMLGRHLRRWKAGSKANLFLDAFYLLWLLLLLLLLWLLSGIKFKVCFASITECKLTWCSIVDISSFDCFHPVKYIEAHQCCLKENLFYSNLDLI